MPANPARRRFKTDEMTPRVKKEGPERTCAATGQKGPPQAFIRFVTGPRNEAGQTAPWPDYTGKMPGRGVYLLPTRAAYELAVKKKVFAHNLETNQPPPPWQELLAHLHKDALQRLGLAKKAGQLVIGMDKVLEQKHANVLKALLLATDAGADAQEKLQRLAQTQALPLLACFKREELSQALGQPNATVIGLARLDTAWPAVQKAHQASIN